MEWNRRIRSSVKSDSVARSYLAARTFPSQFPTSSSPGKSSSRNPTPWRRWWSGSWRTCTSTPRPPSAEIADSDWSPDLQKDHFIDKIVNYMPVRVGQSHRPWLIDRPGIKKYISTQFIACHQSFWVGWIRRLRLIALSKATPFFFFFFLFLFYFLVPYMILHWGASIRWIRTLELRIMSWFFHHCATVAGLQQS